MGTEESLRYRRYNPLLDGPKVGIASIVHWLARHAQNYSWLSSAHYSEMHTLWHHIEVANQRRARAFWRDLNFTRVSKLVKIFKSKCQEPLQKLSTRNLLPLSVSWLTVNPQLPHPLQRCSAQESLIYLSRNQNWSIMVHQWSLLSMLAQLQLLVDHQEVRNCHWSCLKLSTQNSFRRLIHLVSTEHN